MFTFLIQIKKKGYLRNNRKYPSSGDAGNRTLVQTRNQKVFYMLSSQLIFELSREEYIPKTKPYPISFAFRSRHPYWLVHPFSDARWD